MAPPPMIGKGTSMTGFALALVLAAAAIHASFNLMAKRAGAADSTAFVWLGTLVSVAAFAPFAVGILILQKPVITAVTLLFIAVSGVFHVSYCLTLQRAYTIGDLSLVYPIARGTGPLLATLGAILILGERPGLIATGGIVLLALGIFQVAGVGRRGPARGKAVYLTAAYALMPAVFTAAYTIWDKYCMGILMVPPVFYLWFNQVVRAFILAPYALRHRSRVKEVWQQYRKEAIGVGILSPSGYVLILFALTVAPVSYVAPAREISILIAAILGKRLLAEGDAGHRLLGAAAMTIGLICLALG
jgi:drug/metabolite transporter (DMT)-like permease